MDNTDTSTDAPRPDLWELGQAIDLRAPEADGWEVRLAQQDWGVRGYKAVGKLLGERGPEVLSYRRTRRFSRSPRRSRPARLLSIEYCWVGSDRAGQDDLKDGGVRPVGAPFRCGPRSMALWLAGRGAAKTLLAWRDGIARGSAPHDLFVPAEVWTPRIYREAVRRFYLPS